MVTRYDIGGVVLGSTIPLPEVPETRHGPSDIDFSMAPAVAALEPPARFHRRWTQGDDEGATWAYFVREGEAWLIRFPAIGDFRISADGRRIECAPLRDTPEDTIRHLMLDQVLPLALSRQGRIALHASGLVVGGRAIGIVGPSGSGKSTLASTLARAGGALLCDDSLVALPRSGGWIAMPWYPGLRLWPDNAEAGNAGAHARVAHYTTKVRVGESLRFHGSPAPLAALYILSEDGDNVSLRPLPGRDAVVSLVESTYLLAQDDPVALQAQLEFASRLVESVPCHILCYPYRYDVLPRVCEMLLASVEAGAQEPCSTAMPA